MTGMEIFNKYKGLKKASGIVFVNAVETDDDKCECKGSSSWKEHWERFAGESFPTKCATTSGCEGEINERGEHEMVGAHIMEKSLWDSFELESSNDSRKKKITQLTIEVDKVWIAPLCKSCNDRKEERGSFTLNPKTILVTANPEKCRKD